MASEIERKEIDLNHPEVLPREKLVEILIERRLPLEEVHDLEKYALVELFYKFVAPLPQRLHQLRRSKRCAPRSSSESGSAKSLILSGVKKTRKRPLGDVTIPCTTSKMQKRGTGDESVQMETADRNLPDRTNDPDSNNRHTSLECTVVRLNRSSTRGQSKGKIVKLNRKSLGLQLDATISKRAIDECKQEGSSTPVEEKLEQKDTTASSTSSTSLEDDLEQTKKKFKKVAISYEELEQTSQTKKFKKVAITWP